MPFNGSATGTYRREPLPVGQFEPNAFGLYDTMGNAKEWTADCWHSNYEGAPTDGTAWLEEDNGDCSLRVARGGSWFGEPNTLRSAFRARYARNLEMSKTGFRVVRDLAPSRRWIEFHGVYEVGEDRANIAGAHYYEAIFSHPEDQFDFEEKIRGNKANQELMAQGKPVNRELIGGFVPAIDVNMLSSTSTVTNMPLEEHEFHLGDNCIYSEPKTLKGARADLPRPGEMYCTGTSLWEGRSYSRTLEFPEGQSVFIPKGNTIGCAVDIALIQPDLLDQDDMKDARVTCRFEYEIAERGDYMGKFLRIPYLDQYPQAPELIEPDQPWYQAWDGKTPMKVRGFSAYFSPKPFRDQVVEDVCVYVVDGAGTPVPGKKLCLEDTIYSAGSNSLSLEPYFLAGDLVVEPGEYLSGSCLLTKGNFAGDCALYILVDVPEEKRDIVLASPVFTNEGSVNTDFLRGKYCETGIVDYQLTVNGRFTIRDIGRTQDEPWRTIVQQNRIKRDDQSGLCPYIFLDGLELP